MKKRLLTLTLAIICLCTLLQACGDKTEPAGDVTYMVSVKDALGKPCSQGIIVRIMQGSEVKFMQVCNENGEVEKTLPAGEYDVELAFTDGDDAYYYEKAKLTEEKNVLTIVLSNRIKSEPIKLFAQGNENDAYPIYIGSTYAELKNEGRNYFIFKPTEAGNYRFSLAESELQFGYYGAPHFVQESSVVPVENNSFTVSISASMIGSGDTGTTTLVLGIDAKDSSAKSCIINVERIGDALKTIEDEPWTIYKKTVELAEYNLPEGAVIKEFDLTAKTDAYKLVFNESDGFYHLDSAEGPLVLVRLAEDCDYIACFKTILDRSGVSRYFFDEEGNFVKKESYSECLLEYIGYVDLVEGVYPLTKDLEYIIKQRGEYVNWWNPESNTYLFKDASGNNDLTINTELAWLLMCCYLEQ